MAEYDEVEFTKLDAPLQNELRKELGDELRNLFPHGHSKFIEFTLKELDLHSRKNYDYSFGGDPLGNFKRVSAIKKLYPNVDWSSPVGVAIGYLLKQFDVALWFLSSGHKAIVEGPAERWQDISVYSKIISILIGESTKQIMEDKENEKGNKKI
jgi:hypothetical protein